VNDKVLKLSDFDIDTMSTVVSEGKSEFGNRYSRSRILLRESGSDCFSYLPNNKICALNESKKGKVDVKERIWTPAKVTFSDEKPTS